MGPPAKQGMYSFLGTVCESRFAKMKKAKKQGRPQEAVRNSDEFRTSA